MVPLCKALDGFLRIRNIYLLVRVGDSLGEHVAMTAAARLIAQQRHKRVWIATTYPAIFDNHPFVERVFDANRISPWLLRHFITAMKMGGRHFGFFVFRSDEHRKYVDYCRETGAREHLVKLQSDHLGLGLDYSDVTPTVVVSEQERRGATARRDWPTPPYSLIHSIGKLDWTRNKTWGPDKFQEVVDRMDHVKWIQVGLPSDPPLHGTIDLRGSTSVRELVILMEGADFVVCQESMLTHLAAAAGTDAVCVYTGFNTPEVSAYDKVVPVTKDPQVSCAPCWLIDPCPVPGHPCASELPAASVVREAERLLAANRAQGHTTPLTRRTGRVERG